MPRQRIVPDKNTLQRYLESGLTHQQIADIVFSETGKRVGRTAIAAAASRYGLSNPHVRYDKEIPWKLERIHERAYPAIMLRLLGRRRMGKGMSPKEESQLESWLRDLREQGLIVAYAPHTDQGLHYVTKALKDNSGKAPIRKKILTPEELPVDS